MAAVYQEDVKQTVIVVIEECHSAGHRFNEELLGRGRVFQSEAKPSGDFRFEDRQSAGHASQPKLAAGHDVSL